VRGQHYSPPGQPQPRYQPRNRHREARHEEQRLREIAEVAAYLDFVLKAPGIQRHRFTRELFTLSRQVPHDAFVETAQRALRYRIVDLPTVRRIAWLCMQQHEGPLPEADVDEDYQQRPAYQEGCLTDQPDLSVYDQWYLDQEPQDPEEDIDDIPF
jgi:hypothetical protein